MSIKFSRKIKPKAILDMVPMIDIIFQLIIFFMVATTFKTTTGFEMDLPDAKFVDVISKTSLNITIIDKQNIFINDKRYSIENLEVFFKTEFKRNTKIKQSIIIYGDSNIEYQLLIDIMDILRIAGYDNIDLAINKK